MLLQDSRRAARVGPGGELVLLADQDRRLWDEREIDEGLRILDRARQLRSPGPYQLQAAIAAGHVQGSDPSVIAAAYEQLEAIDPSPIVRLNRAVAVALAGQVEEGLALIDAIAGLDGHHYRHGARADPPRRLGRPDAASAAYERALAVTANETERRFYAGRLDELRG
jgi:RNA polymerase sigma-70 factor (ECF subfamily)